jgi:hypothetical protein
MGERTPFAQRVDEDLQDYVEYVSRNTNLSKADVMDEALRRLRDNSTVTDDGQFVVDGEYGASESEGDEISKEDLHENQQRILQMLGEGGSVAETSVPNKNSQGGEMDNENGSGGDETLPDVTDGVQEAERKIASLAGEYDHDECIDPGEVEEIDFRASDEVAHTARYLVPAVAGMIHHELEHGAFSEPVEWSEIREVMRTRLDVSRGSLYNYRQKMVEKGALLPHPSVDDVVVGDDSIETARSRAAAVTDKRLGSEIDVSQMGSKKRERYPDDADEYVGEYVTDWPSEVYYTDEEVYRRQVWNIIKEGMKGILTVKPETGRERPKGDKSRMYEAERAVGAASILGRVISQFGVCEDELHKVMAFAPKTGPEDIEEWAEKWGQVRVDVKAELFGEGADEDEAMETFREVVGVNPAEADEDEMLTAYKAWIMANHPDAGGDEDEVDPAEFRRVAEARQALLG